MKSWKEKITVPESIELGEIKSPYNFEVKFDIEDLEGLTNLRTSTSCGCTTIEKLVPKEGENVLKSQITRETKGEGFIGINYWLGQERLTTKVKFKII